jgi:hypothetical protein
MADAVHAAFVATPQGAPSVVVVVACVYWYTDVPESAGEGGVVGVLEREEWWGLTDTPRPRGVWRAAAAPPHALTASTFPIPVSQIMGSVTH